MALRENPIILRQGFNKLWENNIFLSGASIYLHFVILYKAQALMSNLFNFKYTKSVNGRKSIGDNDMDDYLNTYKYRRNWRRRKRYFRLHIVTRGREFKNTITTRFEKSSLYQQIVQQFSNLGLILLQLINRLREPIRRIKKLGTHVIRWVRDKQWSPKKQKHFTNTSNQVVLLHWYKATTLFSNHFGRELQRVRKQIHWKLIGAFKSLLFRIPIHPDVRRHFYGSTVEIRGRPKGRNRTITYRLREGTLASQTYRNRITLGFGIAKAKIGVFGIRTRLAY